MTSNIIVEQKVVAVEPLSKKSIFQTFFFIFIFTEAIESVCFCLVPKLKNFKIQINFCHQKICEKIGRSRMKAGIEENFVWSFKSINMEELSAKVAQTAAKTGRRLLIFNYFKDPSLECLYENFSLRQKRTGLESFIVGSILSGLNVLCVIGDEDIIELSGLVGLLLIHIFLLVLCRKGYNNNIFWAVIPHVCWHLANAQFFFFSRHSLDWVLLLNFLIYVTLPLRLRYCIMFSIGTTASYGLILYGCSGINCNTFEEVSLV